jgi:hypothetical protein
MKGKDSLPGHARDLPKECDHEEEDVWAAAARKVGDGDGIGAGRRRRSRLR